MATPTKSGTPLPGTKRTTCSTSGAKSSSGTRATSTTRRSSVAEIEITLPTVQYGNVKVRATPEEFGFKLDEPSAFGMALAVYQAAFTLGWRDGAQMDVGAPQAASREAAPGNPQAAAKRLAGGRKPRMVDEANEMAKQVI